MERTKRYPKRLPDIIINSPTDNFTMVPNEALRNPAISWKAKGILSFLLGNADNEWYSYKKTITGFGKDGELSISSGITELEKAGYLIRLRYRDKQTKRIRGSIWICTGCPGQFNRKVIEHRLRKHGLEPVNPQLENLSMGKPQPIKPWARETLGEGNPGSRFSKPNNNNNKQEQDFKEKEISNIFSGNGNITLSQFDDFWKIYPNNKEKGLSKKRWKQLCEKKTKDRPTWDVIVSAIEAQKKTPRWQDPDFIPHAATWLNQERWIDDPNEMVAYGRNGKGQSNKPPKPNAGVYNEHLKFPEAETFQPKSRRREA